MRALIPFVLSSSIVAMTVGVIAPSAAPQRGDARARAAAQRGLDFLAEATPAWQARHNCYGCHVQAVTMEAFAVGKKHSYDLSNGAIETVLAGLLTVNGGVRSEHGLSHSGGREQADAKSYGGAALASFDLIIDDRATDDLVNTARALLEHQKEDGSVHPEVPRFPVQPGPIHATYRAVQTWRQAFARTADDAWLAPLRRGEAYLKAAAESLIAGQSTTKEHIGREWGRPPRSIQDLNFAALGLVEAGAGRSEKLVTRLRQALLVRQNDDGGWGFQKRNPSDAYATGQTLYTLRMLGMSESDRSVRRATAWLVERQQKSGSWSNRGSGKAEAMWAVLGLVSLDVVSLTVSGIEDGMRVEGAYRLTATASDNEGRGIEKVELFVDDVRIHVSKGGTLTYKWQTAGLDDGMHLVDLVATNADGNTGRRRLAVYCGDYFLTDVGSRFSDGGTLITLRNIASTSTGEVRTRVSRDGNVVWESLQKATAGPMSFFWKGEKAGKGKKAPSNAGAREYVATLSYIDAQGHVRQTVEHPFVHDTREGQLARYGEVQGQLQSDSNQTLANTWVELIDEEGHVVQRSRTTRSGSYLFKNVNKGKYRVRVKKKGFVDFEGNVEASVGAQAEQNIRLQAH